VNWFKKILAKIMGIFKKLIFRTKKAVAKVLTLSTTSTSATWSPNLVTNSGATLTWDVTGDITPTSQNVDDPTFDLSANTGTVNMDVYDVTNLTSLSLFSNGLTSLNVSDAINLNYLYFTLNQLTSINISTNISLIDFSCNNNSLTTLDVTNNVNLTRLTCSANLLTSLNVSNNVNLTDLQFHTNQLTSINLNLNINLTRLDCSSNSLSLIDLSANTLLNDVYINGNNMSATATDQIYIDLASGSGVSGYLQIRNNRTSASDTARATLVSRGWTFNESLTT
jgi:Leucine-rich repeat (LRR) protein